MSVPRTIPINLTVEMEGKTPFYSATVKVGQGAVVAVGSTLVEALTNLDKDMRNAMAIIQAAR